jgi:hypothetical protein
MVSHKCMLAVSIGEFFYGLEATGTAEESCN